jgi:hypothetical protein
MSILIDEYGRPIILFDAQDTKKRIKGPEAYKVNYNKHSQILLLLEV